MTEIPLGIYGKQQPPHPLLTSSAPGQHAHGKKVLPWNSWSPRIYRSPCLCLCKAQGLERESWTTTTTTNCTPPGSPALCTPLAASPSSLTPLQEPLRCQGRHYKEMGLT